MPESEQVWPIPVSYRASNGKEGLVMISEKEAEIVIEGIGQEDVVLFNPDFYFFYVV